MVQDEQEAGVGNGKMCIILRGKNFVEKLLAMNCDSLAIL